MVDHGAILAAQSRPGSRFAPNPGAMMHGGSWRQGLVRGGKSGLHRAECQVTPGGCEPTESATESKPPKPARDGKGEMAR